MLYVYLLHRNDEIQFVFMGAALWLTQLYFMALLLVRPSHNPNQIFYTLIRRDKAVP